MAEGAHLAKEAELESLREQTRALGAKCAELQGAFAQQAAAASAHTATYVQTTKSFGEASMATMAGWMMAHTLHEVIVLVIDGAGVEAEAQDLAARSVQALWACAAVPCLEVLLSRPGGI